MYARIFLDHIEGSVLTLFPCRQQCIAATGSAASSEPCGVRRVLPLDGSRRHDWVFRNLWNDVDVFNIFHIFFGGGKGCIYIYVYIRYMRQFFVNIWTMNHEGLWRILIRWYQPGPPPHLEAKTGSPTRDHRTWPWSHHQRQQAWDGLGCHFVEHRQCIQNIYNYIYI